MERRKMLFISYGARHGQLPFLTIDLIIIIIIGGSNTSQLEPTCLLLLLLLLLLVTAAKWTTCNMPATGNCSRHTAIAKINHLIARIKTECQQRHFKTFLVNGALVTNASCAIVPQLMSSIVVAKGEETGIVMEIAGRLLRAALSGATSCCDLCCGCCCFALFGFFLALLTGQLIKELSIAEMLLLDFKVLLVWPDLIQSLKRPIDIEPLLFFCHVIEEIMKSIQRYVFGIISICYVFHSNISKGLLWQAI